MFLKVLTTALVVFGLALLLGTPFFLGERPSGEDQIALAQYGARMLAYFTVTAFVWIGVAACALMLMRRARRQYLEDQRENLAKLVEGTLRDHERKK